MKYFLKRNMRHLAAVAVLVCVQLFIRDLSAGYYYAVTRPRLLAAGAVPCAGYPPRTSRGTPEACDLVVVAKATHVIEEQFYSQHGDTITTIGSQGARWLYTHVSYVANKTTLVLPILAFIALAVALVHKMFRVHAIFKWQLSRVPSDRFEEVLQIYGVPVFLSGILSTLVGR